jgi:hypothetical protein
MPTRTDEARRRRHAENARRWRARHLEEVRARQREAIRDPQVRARRNAQRRTWYHEPDNKTFERLRRRLKTYHELALAAGLSEFEAVRLMMLAEIQFERGETRPGSNWFKALLDAEAAWRPVREAVERRLRRWEARWN